VGQLTQITDAVFEAEINADTPVLVDFWAEWCGPCRMVAPVLEQIAVEQAGKLKIVKLNVDENQHTPMHFNVSGIPTMILQGWPDGRADRGFYAQAAVDEEDRAASGLERDGHGNHPDARLSTCAAWIQATHQPRSPRLVCWGRR